MPPSLHAHAKPKPLFYLASFSFTLLALFGKQILIFPSLSLPHPVVQLFNAVSQHSKQLQTQVKAADTSQKKKAKGQFLFPKTLNMDAFFVCSVLYNVCLSHDEFIMLQFCQPLTRNFPRHAERQKICGEEVASSEGRLHDEGKDEGLGERGGDGGRGRERQQL